MIQVSANDKRRKDLKKEFKNTTGLDPIMVLDKEFISKSPRVYMSRYTHYLEQKIISYEEELESILKELKK